MGGGHFVPEVLSVSRRIEMEGVHDVGGIQHTASALDLIHVLGPVSGSYHNDSIRIIGTDRAYNVLRIGFDRRPWKIGRFVADFVDDVIVIGVFSGIGIKKADGSTFGIHRIFSVDMPVDHGIHAELIGQGDSLLDIGVNALSAGFADSISILCDIADQTDQVCTPFIAQVGEGRFIDIVAHVVPLKTMCADALKDRSLSVGIGKLCAGYVQFAVLVKWSLHAALRLSGQGVIELEIIQCRLTGAVGFTTAGRCRCRVAYTSL